MAKSIIMKEVADEFRDTVDIDNSDSLRKFFFRYSFFTTNELAIILGKCARTIRKYKIKAGIRRSGGPKQRPKHINIPILADPPENWNTAEWWRDNYAKYGTKALSRITGVERQDIKRRLRRHGIVLDRNRKTKSTNPYCNLEWIEEHYIKQKLTPRECAKLAGISDSTFRDWLVLHGIQVRCRYGSSLLDQVGSVRASTI